MNDGLTVIQQEHNENGEYIGFYAKDNHGRVFYYKMCGYGVDENGKGYVDCYSNGVELETKPDNSGVCDMYDYNIDSTYDWGWFRLLVIMFAIGLLSLELVW